MIGPGLAAWLAAHQATPLSLDEVYPWPNVKVSVLPVLIANQAGVTVRTIVGWDEASNEVLQPGPGVVAAPPPSPSPPSAQDPAPALPLMYDSTTAADIPADAQLVAGYVDGAFAWSEADKARFPKFVSISATGGSLADFWDCENGDFSVWQAAQQVRANMGTGIYCSLSLAESVARALAALDIAQGDRLLWVADWTGEPHMPAVPGATVVACQYANPATSGGHYDLSVVTDEFMTRFA